MFLLILKILFGQFVIIAVIFFILWKILDKELVESAIYKLETVNLSAADKELSELSVTAAHALNHRCQERISDAISRKTKKTVELVIDIDKKIKGGLIIKLKGITIDHSLLSRLKESGLIK